MEKKLYRSTTNKTIAGVCAGLAEYLNIDPTIVRVIWALVGLSGGGPITAGLFILGCTPLAAVGTSVFVICVMSIVGFLMHLSVGRVDWDLVKYLLSGTLIGAFLGPWLMSKLDRNKVNRVLRPIVAVVNTIMSIMILMK